MPGLQEAPRASPADLGRGYVKTGGWGKQQQAKMAPGLRGSPCSAPAKSWFPSPSLFPATQSENPKWVFQTPELASGKYESIIHTDPLPAFNHNYYMANSATFIFSSEVCFRHLVVGSAVLCPWGRPRAGTSVALSQCTSCDWETQRQCL